MWTEAELREIRVFLTLVEELHFGRTAERLDITPSYASQLIRTLEARLGGRLFDRTSRRVSPTPLADQFKTRVAPAYLALTRAVAETRELATGLAGVLRVGFTLTTEGPALGRLIETFQTRHPECRVDFQEVDVWDPYTALRGGTIDILVNWLSGAEPDLTTGPAITRARRVLAVARHHNLSRATSVSLEQLADEQAAQLPASLPAALADALLPPRTPSGRSVPRTRNIRSIQEIIAHVARGEIVHPTIAELAVFQRQDIALIPIYDLPALALGLIWPTQKTNAKIRALANTARSLDIVERPGQRQSTTS